MKSSLLPRGHNRLLQSRWLTANWLSTIKCHMRHVGPQLAAKKHGSCADIDRSYRDADFEGRRMALRYYGLRRENDGLKKGRAF
ncbi:hypothetical protein V8C40DRAFT_246636 [Trichoderma camerunense]